MPSRVSCTTTSISVAAGWASSRAASSIAPAIERPAEVPLESTRATSGSWLMNSSRRWPRLRSTSTRATPATPTTANRNATPRGMNSDSDDGRGTSSPRRTAAAGRRATAASRRPAASCRAGGRRAPPQPGVEGLAQAVDRGVVVGAAPALGQRGPARGAGDEQRRRRASPAPARTAAAGGRRRPSPSSGLPLGRVRRPRRPGRRPAARARPAGAGARRCRAAAGSAGSCR